MQSQGIIFDFNGVLWWDSDLQEQSWKDFSARVRGAPLSQQEYDLHVHGRTNQHTIEHLLGKTVAERELEQLVQEKESVYRALCMERGDEFRLSPGAAFLLDYLRDHHIPRTIATGSEISNLRFFFEQLHLDQWFDIKKVAYDDGKTPGKPAPDIFLNAARHLQLAPAACMVIEDSRSGIEAAYAAHVGTVIALGTPEKHAKLLQEGKAHRIIQHLGQIDPRKEFTTL